MKTFHILSNKLPISIFSSTDDILTMNTALHNFNEPIFLISLLSKYPCNLKAYFPMYKITSM